MDRKYKHRFDFFSDHHSDVTKINLIYMNFLWESVIEIKLS